MNLEPLQMKESADILSLQIILDTVPLYWMDIVWFISIISTIANQGPVEEKLAEDTEALEIS